MGCGFFWGILFIIVGFWIWVSNHGLVIFRFSRDWPVLLIVLGVYLILMIRRRRFFIHHKD